MDKEKLEQEIKRITPGSTEDLINRFAYHPPKSKETVDKHATLREECFELAKFIHSIVPKGREQDIAITMLEQVMFWANAGIARNDRI